MWGSDTSLLRENLQVPSWLGGWVEGGVYGQIVPQPPSAGFDVGLLLFNWCVGVRLVVKYFSEGVVSYVAVDSVCSLEEVSWGSSQVAILSCSPRPVQG